MPTYIANSWKQRQELWRRVRTSEPAEQRWLEGIRLFSRLMHRAAAANRNPAASIAASESAAMLLCVATSSQWERSVACLDCVPALHRANAVEAVVDRLEQQLPVNTALVRAMQSVSASWHGAIRLLGSANDARPHTRDRAFLAAWRLMGSAPFGAQRLWDSALYDRLRPSRTTIIGAAAADAGHQRWTRALGLLRSHGIEGIAHRLQGFLRSVETSPDVNSSEYARVSNSRLQALLRGDEGCVEALRLGATLNTEAGSEALFAATLPERWDVALALVAAMKARGVNPRGSALVLTNMYLAHPAYTACAQRFELLDSGPHTAVLAGAVSTDEARRGREAMLENGLKIPAGLARAFETRIEKGRHGRLAVPFPDHLSCRDWTHLLTHANTEWKSTLLATFVEHFTAHSGRAPAGDTNAPFHSRVIMSADLLTAAIRCQLSLSQDDGEIAILFAAQLLAAGCIHHTLSSSNALRPAVPAAIVIASTIFDNVPAHQLPTWFVLGATSSLEGHLQWTHQTVAITATAHARVGRWYKALDLISRLDWTHPSQASVAVAIASYLGSAPAAGMLRPRLLTLLHHSSDYAAATQTLQRAPSGPLSESRLQALNRAVMLCNSATEMRELHKAWDHEFSRLDEDAWLNYVAVTGTWTAALRALAAQRHLTLTDNVQEALSHAPTAVLVAAADSLRSRRPIVSVTCDVNVAMRQGAARDALDGLQFLARRWLVRRHMLMQLAQMFSDPAFTVPVAHRIDVQVKMRQLHRTRSKLQTELAARVQSSSTIPYDAEATVVQPWAQSESFLDMVEQLRAVHCGTYGALLALRLAHREGVRVTLALAMGALRKASQEGTWLGAIAALHLFRTLERAAVMPALAACRGSWTEAVTLLSLPPVAKRLSAALWYEALLLLHEGARSRDRAEAWLTCLEVMQNKSQVGIPYVVRLARCRSLVEPHAASALGLVLARRGGSLAKLDDTVHAESAVALARIVQGIARRGDWQRACKLLATPLPIRFEDDVLDRLITTVLHRRPEMKAAIRSVVHHTHLRADLQKLLLDEEE
jgi:hypothetical protein